MGMHGTSADNIESRMEAGASREAHTSGVSWGAVAGGAFVISALYLILLALGAGFGLSKISPWANVAVTATTVGAVAIVWLIVTEIVACALGGYLAGRLRTKWTVIHNDEVFFRDTANGFLAWAVALVVSVGFLSSAAASMAGSLTQARAVAEGASTGASANRNMYFVDALFRGDRGASGDVAVKAEAARILITGISENHLTAEDQNYLARLVAVRTGISQLEAEKRVSDVMSQARQTADAALKATSRLLLWLFVSLLMGALTASYAATIGGRQRDHIKAV
jgi:hypothetical protein